MAWKQTFTNVMDKVTEAAQLLSMAYVDLAKLAQKVSKEAIDASNKLEQNYVGMVVMAFTEWSETMQLALFRMTQGPEEQTTAMHATRAACSEFSNRVLAAGAGLDSVGTKVANAATPNLILDAFKAAANDSGVHPEYPRCDHRSGLPGPIRYVLCCIF